MKTTNYGEPYTHRITLRLSDKQMEFIAKNCEVMGVSPSDFLRMSVNTAMYLAQETEKKLGGGAGTHENVKADIDDIIQQ